MVRWASSTSTKTFSRVLTSAGMSSNLWIMETMRPRWSRRRSSPQVPLALGDLDVAEADRLQVAEELRLQLVAVHEHQHGRVLEDRVLDEPLGDVIIV